MTDPVVSKVTTSGSPIVTYTVASERMDEQALSWFVDNEVAKALLAVKGVGQVARVGGVDREVHVDLDSARMQALGVTAEADVSRQLRAVQQDASGGRTDWAGGEQTVRTIATVQSAAELAQLDIPLQGGRRVKPGRPGHGCRYRGRATQRGACWTASPWWASRSPVAVAPARWRWMPVSAACWPS
jgi:multidrug efflux pump subunit AcrB